MATSGPKSTGGGVSTYADFAALPTDQPDGTLAVTLDDHKIYVYNLATTTWELKGEASGLDLVSFTQFGGY